MNNVFYNGEGKDMDELMFELTKITQESQLQASNLITEHFTKKLKELSDNYNKLDTKIKLLEESKNELKSDFNDYKESNNVKVNKLESKIDNFKNDDTGLFDLYKATARARVHKIVGEKGSLKYILFYDPFAKKIYSDIYNHFDANNSGNIKMYDANTAISMAKSWKPNRKYINNKLKEYQRMNDNGTLKEPRKSAFEKYLDLTEGGKNIEF